MATKLKYIEIPGSGRYEWKSGLDKGTLLNYICTHQSEIIWEDDGTIQSSPLDIFYKNTSVSGTSNICHVVAVSNTSYSRVPSPSYAEGNASIHRLFNWTGSIWKAVGKTLWEYVCTNSTVVINNITYNKWVLIHKTATQTVPTLESEVMYTPVSWGLLTLNYRVQVESSNKDGEGLDIASNYMKNSSSSVSTNRLAVAAETGSWDDLSDVNKPKYYLHTIRLEQSASPHYYFSCKILTRRSTAYTELSQLYSDAGGPTLISGSITVNSAPNIQQATYENDNMTDWSWDVFYSLTITHTIRQVIGGQKIHIYSASVNTYSTNSGNEGLGDTDFNSIVGVTTKEWLV